MNVDVGDVGEHSADRMAAALATARYFSLYLQGRGKRKGVYDCLRSQHPGELKGRNATEAGLAGLASERGKSLRDVDEDFSAWFAQPSNRR